MFASSDSCIKDLILLSNTAFMLLSEFHTLRLLYINLTMAKWKLSLLNNASNTSYAGQPTSSKR